MSKHRTSRARPLRGLATLAATLAIVAASLAPPPPASAASTELAAAWPPPASTVNAGEPKPKGPPEIPKICQGRFVASKT